MRNRAATPVHVAYGLCVHNVADASRMVEPSGLNLRTGVRTDGALDAAKLAAFMHAVAQA